MCKIQWEWISRTKFLVFPSNYSEISCCWSITIHVESMSTICNSAWNITRCVANISIFCNLLSWLQMALHWHRKLWIDPEYPSRPPGKMIKSGNILSNDLSIIMQMPRLRGPGTLLHFLQIFSLVEIVSDLNRWHLIKVHIDAAVQEQVLSCYNIQLPLCHT